MDALLDGLNHNNFQRTELLKNDSFFLIKLKIFKQNKSYSKLYSIFKKGICMKKTITLMMILGLANIVYGQETLHTFAL